MTSTDGVPVQQLISRPTSTTVDIGINGYWVRRYFGPGSIGSQCNDLDRC
jgi:hypothetical protein